MENKNIIKFFTFTVIAMLWVSVNMESIEEVKEILRARRAAAPRSYMHAEDCKGVNRTFALMNDYPFCQTFVVCDPAGHKYVYDCPSGLWFNETTQECDYPENLEKEFREECGNLISSFEADFFKRMEANKKNQLVSTNNQEFKPSRRPVISKKRKQNRPPDSEENAEIPDHYVDESQTAVTPRRRSKPHAAVVTQPSENMVYEYYETPQEPITSRSPGKMSSVPIESNKDFEIPQQPLRNTRPSQMITQSPFQPVQGDTYDYYDGPIPQLQPAQLRRPLPQQIIPQEHHQQSPQLSSQPIYPRHHQQMFDFPQQIFQRPQQISQLPSQQPSPLGQRQESQQTPQLSSQQPSPLGQRQESQQTSQLPSQQPSPIRQRQESQQSFPIQQQQPFRNIRVQPKNEIEYDI